MLDPTFKFIRSNPPGDAQYNHEYSEYYSVWFKNVSPSAYLGCIFKSKKHPRPFYVLRADVHCEPFMHFKTRLEAAIHLLFQDL